jgi:hypothetical protein
VETIVTLFLLIILGFVLIGLARLILGDGAKTAADATERVPPAETGAKQARRPFNAASRRGETPIRRARRRRSAGHGIGRK